MSRTIGSGRSNLHLRFALSVIFMLTIPDVRCQPLDLPGLRPAPPNTAGATVGSLRQPDSTAAETHGSGSVGHRELLIVTDSVVLGALPVIRHGLPDWRIDVEGRSALMLPGADRNSVV